MDWEAMCRESLQSSNATAEAIAMWISNEH